MQCQQVVIEHPRWHSTKNICGITLSRCGIPYLRQLQDQQKYIAIQGGCCGLIENLLCKRCMNAPMMGAANQTTSSSTGSLCNYLFGKPRSAKKTTGQVCIAIVFMLPSILFLRCNLLQIYQLSLQVQTTCSHVSLWPSALGTINSQPINAYTYTSL